VVSSIILPAQRSNWLPDQPKGNVSTAQATTDLRLRLLYWTLPVLLVAGTGAVLVAGGLTLFFDWEFQIGESMNSYFADRMIRSGTLYTVWTPLAPYFPIYPPGWYAAVAPFELLDREAMWQGRLISMASLTVAAFSGWAVARRLGCWTSEAVVAALAFLFIGVTALLIASARPDALGLGLIGCSVLAATRWEDQGENRDLLLSALLSAAYIVVKYNFAPIAAGVALALWLRDRRAGVRFALVTAAATLMVLVIAQLASSGSFFSNSSDFGRGYSLAPLREVLVGLAGSLPSLLLVVAAAEFFAVLFRGRGAPRAVHLAWLGSVVVVLSAVKIGASLNYVAPAALLSSMLVGAALMRVRTRSGLGMAALASAVLAGSVVFTIAERIRDVPRLPEQFDALDEINHDAADRLTEARAPVFGDRNDLTIAAGKGPSFESVPMSILAAGDHWDTGPLAARIRERRFGMIQTGFDIASPVPTSGGIPAWPIDVVEAVRASYCETWHQATQGSTGPGIWLYEPCEATAAERSSSQQGPLGAGRED
jgi:hypothetical protein